MSAAPHLRRRRDAVAALWELREDDVVLVAAGDAIHVPGRADLTYRFRAHSEYLYLTDRERPGGVLAYAPGDGWVDFVAPVTREERLWTNAPAVDEGVDVAALERWVAGRRPIRLGAGGEEGEHRRALNAVRRRKDEVELDRMRRAASATAAGFRRLPELLRAGTTERAVQIELEAEFFRNGADGVAFDTIVGSGPNSAVLHFAPGARVLADGELALVDAGAEVEGYAADVTRTYAVSATLSGEQAALYDVVRAAKDAATSRCTPGTEWLDVHRAAATVIAEGLVGLGLLRGTPESLVESGAATLFFPHGIGHMVGLGVRDAGEVLPGRTGTAPGLPAIRVDLPLEAGFAMTVEPGVYLVPSLLAEARGRGDVVWEQVDGLAGFGGIRLEDDVLVTDGEPELLTPGIPL
jgi:Xaa-Pro aminopeptidase